LDWWINLLNGSDFTNKPSITGWNIGFDDDSFGYLTNEEEKKEEKIICTVDKVQCFSTSLGYPCCSQGAEVIYENGDGKLSFEFNTWCGIRN